MLHGTFLGRGTSLIVTVTGPRSARAGSGSRAGGRGQRRCRESHKLSVPKAQQKLPLSYLRILFLLRHISDSVTHSRRTDTLS